MYVSGNGNTVSIFVTKRRKSHVSGNGNRTCLRRRGGALPVQQKLQTRILPGLQ
jgi:hypothetical protein